MVPIPRELVAGLKTKRLSVVNSLLSLKIICPGSPGANTVTVEISPLAVAEIAAPTKFILDTLFAVPTKYPSSKILIPPANVTGGISCQ